MRKELLRALIMFVMTTGLVILIIILISNINTIKKLKESDVEYRVVVVDKDNKLMDKGDSTKLVCEEGEEDEILINIIEKDFLSGLVYTMEIVNNTYRDISIEYPTSKIYSYKLFNESGIQVFDYDEGRMYTQSKETMDINKGDSSGIDIDLMEAYSSLSKGKYRIDLTSKGYFGCFGDKVLEVSSEIIIN